MAKSGRPRKTVIVDEATESFVPIPELPPDELHLEPGFNPLSDEPISREYATPEIAEHIVDPLEEPVFHKKNFDEVISEQNGGAGGFNLPPNPDKGSGSPSAGPAAASDPMMNPNPAYNELEDKDKKAAAKQMVEAVLDTYDQLTVLGSKAAQVSERKIRKEQREGIIDPQRTLQVDESGNRVTVIQFVQAFNQQVEEAVAPDPQFRAKVQPPMERIFVKRGWGMTDEQFVMFAFAKDLSIKAGILINMRRGINEIMADLREEVEMRNSASPAPQPMRPSPQASAPEPGYNEPEDDIITGAVDEPQREQAYNRRLEELQAEQEMLERLKKQARDRAEGVQKMNITFDDNPLRTTPPADYPAPEVKETFEPGQEITDNSEQPQ